MATMTDEEYGEALVQELHGLTQELLSERAAREESREVLTELQQENASLVQQLEQRKQRECLSVEMESLRNQVDAKKREKIQLLRELAALKRYYLRLQEVAGLGSDDGDEKEDEFDIENNELLHDSCHQNGAGGTDQGNGTCASAAADKCPSTPSVRRQARRNTSTGAKRLSARLAAANLAAGERSVSGRGRSYSPPSSPRAASKSPSRSSRRCVKRLSSTNASTTTSNTDTNNDSSNSNNSGIRSSLGGLHAVPDLLGGINDSNNVTAANQSKTCSLDEASMDLSAIHNVANKTTTTNDSSALLAQNSEPVLMKHNMKNKPQLPQQPQPKQTSTRYHSSVSCISSVQVPPATTSCLRASSFSTLNVPKDLTTTTNTKSPQTHIAQAQQQPQQQPQHQQQQQQCRRRSREPLDNLSGSANHFSSSTSFNASGVMSSDTNSSYSGSGGSGSRKGSNTGASTTTTTTTSNTSEVSSRIENNNRTTNLKPVVQSTTKSASNVRTSLFDPLDIEQETTERIEDDYNQITKGSCCSSGSLHRTNHSTTSEGDEMTNTSEADDIDEDMEEHVYKAASCRANMPPSQPQRTVSPKRSPSQNETRKISSLEVLPLPKRGENGTTHPRTEGMFRSLDDFSDGDDDDDDDDEEEEEEEEEEDGLGDAGHASAILEKYNYTDDTNNKSYNHLDQHLLGGGDDTKSHATGLSGEPVLTDSATVFFNDDDEDGDEVIVFRPQVPSSSHY